MSPLDIRTLRTTRAGLGCISSICLAGCAAGVRAFFAGQSKNGFASLPLAWYLALMLGPLLAFTCFLAMWRVREGSNLWLWLGAVLVAPQLLVWVMTLDGVLHYLGIVNHGLFFG
jgi:hypothetical protein